MYVSCGITALTASTACGSLENIVCETLEGCEACVKYLRQHNIGRASFIALAQMDQWRSKMNSNKAAPQNTPRLFDLIAVSEDRLKGAFYFALRDTLVCETLEMATKIAFVGSRAVWRVVTYDGE